MSVVFEEMKKRPRVLPRPFLDKYNKHVCIYDIETYQNYLGFRYRTANPNDNDYLFRLVNVISENGKLVSLNPVEDQIDAMFDYLFDTKPLLCGFNNIAFDDILLKIVYGYQSEPKFRKDLNSKIIWDIVQNIMFKKHNERTDEQRDYLYNLKYKVKLPFNLNTIDLRAMFFYNPQTTKSLKEIGIALGLPFLQDLPYKYDKILTPEEIEHVEVYCGNDLDITAAAFNHFESKITLFETINERCKFQINVQGSTEPSAAVDWLMWEYEQETGLNKWDVKKMVEFPLNVTIADCLPNVTYDTKELQNLFAKFQQTVLTLDQEKIDAADGDLRRVRYLTKCLTNEVTIGEGTYKTGVGGLHSIDLPEALVTEGDYVLIEKDVVSYYPNIIRARGLHPKHLTSKWNELYSNSIQERVHEKNLIKTTVGEVQKRHKENSDSLKLRLNGTFGHLLFTMSTIYCPYAGYSVTLTGQLWLLKLIEMLHLANIRCVSANTDGVLLYVHKNDIDKMNEICGKWEELTQMELEETRFEGVFRHDVNNYVAIEENGKVKTKGKFRNYTDLQKKNDGLIVYEAVCEYYRTGTPVEETIKNCTDINKFTYYYKCTGGNEPTFLAFDCFNGNPPKKVDRVYHQKTFRWYKSTFREGWEIYRERIAKPTAKSKIGDVAKIPRSEGAMIINMLPGEFPVDVDYKQYINKAYEVIQRCTMLKLVKEHEQKAQELRNMGLYPFPKHGKDSARGFMSCSINKKWSWLRLGGKETNSHDGYYIGGGIYTGIHKAHNENTQTGVIDIDDPELAQEFFDLWREENHNGLVVWHGEYTIEQVREGFCKFKVVYKVPEQKNRHRNSTDKMKKEHGVEYLYGKTAVMWGKYDKEDAYDYYNPWYGELVEMPERIEEWVFANIPKIVNRRKNKKTVAPEDETATNLREIGNPCGNEHERENFNEDIERAKKLIGEVLPHWYFREEAHDKEHKFVGHCPYRDEHTSKSNDSNFDITLKPGEFIPFATCFHETCRPSINNLRKQINKLWGELRVEEIKNKLTEKIQINEVEREVADGFETIDDAFKSENTRLLITAPTGCGKTYRSALYIIEQCKKNRKVIYAAANKLEMRQINDHIKELTGESYEHMFVQLLESGEKLEEDKTEAKDDNENITKIGRNTMVVITNHSYLLRKGEFSNLYYSILLWIENNDVDVIIDEFDNYIEKSTYHFPIGGRYIMRTRKGMQPVYQKVNTCPKFSGNGGCLNCQYRIWQEIDTNNYNLPILNTRSRINGEDWEEGQKLIDLPKWSFNRYSEENEAMSVPTRGKNGENFVTEYRNIETHENYWNDKEYKFYLEDGEQYSVKNIFRDFVETSYFPTVSKQFPTYEGEKITKEEILMLSEEEQKNVVFCHMPCDVPVISCKDMSVLKYLDQKTNRLIFLTATISPSAQQFVLETIPTMGHCDIQVSEQGVDDLLIIGTPDNLQISRKNVVYTEEFAKYGDVLIFQSTAARALHLYTKMPGDFPACLYRENSIYRQDKFANKDIHHIITNSRGALGRGVSLANVRTTVCDCLAFKPSGAFDLTKFEPDDVKQQQDLDRLIIVEQNLGRSLRGKGRKVHIMYNATLEELQHFAKRFGTMVKGNIYCEIVDNNDMLKANVLSFLEKGSAPNITDENKPIVNLQEIKDKLKECYEQKINWSTARKQLNLDREAKKLPHAHRKEFITECKTYYKKLN